MLACRCVRIVLVVDDDPKTLAFTVHALGSDYPVLSATSCEEAVRVATRAQPDAIVLDVAMHNGRTGRATFRELRRKSETRDIGVVMLSEPTEPEPTFADENGKQYAGSTPSACIEKPATTERLLAAVANVIEGHPRTACDRWSQ